MKRWLLLAVLGSVSWAARLSADCTIFPGQLPCLIDTQLLSSAATQITVPYNTSNRDVHLATSGVTWTLTAKPTISTTLDSASNALSNGQPIVVRNVDTNPASCIKLQDNSLGGRACSNNNATCTTSADCTGGATCYGTELFLGGANRLLCGRTSGTEGGLQLRFNPALGDGGGWEVAMSGGQVYEDSVNPQPKGEGSSLFFNLTDFDITTVVGLGRLLALGTTIFRTTHVKIQPDGDVACASSPDQRCFALSVSPNATCTPGVNCPNNDLRGGWQKVTDLEGYNSSGTETLNYGDTLHGGADGALRYSGPFSSSLDVANRGNLLAARLIEPLIVYYDVVPSSATTVFAVGSAVNGAGANITEGLVQTALPQSCTVVAGSVTAAGSPSWPSAVHYTLTIRKNSSANIASTPDINAAGVYSFGAVTGSYVGSTDQWAVQFTNTGTSGSHIYLKVYALCAPSF